MEKNKPAIITLNELLLKQGLSQEEIDSLLGQFLQEEAREYIEVMKKVEEGLSKQEIEKIIEDINK